MKLLNQQQAPKCERLFENLLVVGVERRKLLNGFYRRTIEVGVVLVNPA
jgi:hypothetical protein